MVQNYQDNAQMSEIRQPAPPASVLNAVKVMYAGAAVSLIHVVIALVTESATKAAIRKARPQLSASMLATATHAWVIIGAVVTLLGAAMWIWIARSCMSGKNWARVTGTVFFAICALGTVYDLANPAAAAVRIVDVVLSLIGLAAVVLLWLGNSSAYFRFSRQPQS